MRQFRFSWLAIGALTLGLLGPAEARAVSFGPFAIVYPSSFYNEDTTIEVTPTGSITLDIATVPYSTPQLFSLTDVSFDAGPLHVTLDPTISTPALGVIQTDGTFLIPTLFLRGNDGSGDFDLAIPNVTGRAYGAPAAPIGLFSQFQIDAGEDLFTVVIYANVPEPGTLLLLSLGCAALALRARKEISR